MVLAVEAARDLWHQLGVALDIHNEPVIQCLKELCCRRCNVPMPLMMSADRTNRTAYPRQVIMLLAHEAGFSAKVIAMHLNRGRGNVTHGIEAIKARMDTKPEWRELVNDLRTEAEKELHIAFTHRSTNGTHH